MNMCGIVICIGYDLKTTAGKNFILANAPGLKGAYDDVKRNVLRGVRK